MRNRSALAVTAVVIVAVPIWMAAQQGRGGGPGGGRGVTPVNPLAQGRGIPPLQPDNLPFNKRDLSGIWRGDKYGYNATFVPPLTSEGQKKFDAQKPSYGAEPGTPAAQNAQVPIGRRRAVPPALGNDYVGACNPLGLVRLLLYNPSPMEIVMTPNRLLQFFEWTWDRREVWLGQPLPDVDAYLPRWNGYSVGKWEGDTMVVTSNGLDDRQWLDHFGYPISDQARVEERWNRVAHNILQLNITVTDPKIYTQPWKSDLVRFRLIPLEAISEGIGWPGLAEDKCVPFDEVDEYNRNLRNPAVGVPGVEQKVEQK